MNITLKGDGIPITKSQWQDVVNAAKQLKTVGFEVTLTDFFIRDTTIKTGITFDYENDSVKFADIDVSGLNITGNTVWSK